MSGIADTKTGGTDEALEGFALYTLSQPKL